MNTLTNEQHAIFHADAFEAFMAMKDIINSNDYSNEDSTAQVYCHMGSYKMHWDFSQPSRVKCLVSLLASK